MDELLHLHEGPGKQLKSALAIVAPLLGAVLSTIVGKEAGLSARVSSA